MDLLEYQAKELFRQMGIPVLPSQRIDHPSDIKGLKIPYPIALKSQVHAGERGKAGGIRFVENTIDAVAAAQTIFRLPIVGEYPQVLLAEAKYNPEQEFYLAIVLDASTRRPLLLGSQQGGMEVESNLAQMQQVVVDQEFSPFYARRLALKMGLQGPLIQSITSVIEKMYRLFVQQDLDLVEINPLAVSSTGELMALDGKVIANDAALGRQGSLVALTVTPNQVSPARTSAAVPALNLVRLSGNIGILCNGAGLAMATLDLIHRAKGRPASFVNLGGMYPCCDPPVPMQEQIERGLDLIVQDKGVKVILVNLLGSATPCLQIAEAIAQAVKWQLPNQKIPPLVVRLMGTQLQPARELLEAINVPVFEYLDEAIAYAVALTQEEQPSLLLASA